MTVAAPLRRRFAGLAPFEEVWFIEGSLDADHGFWLRYALTTTDGRADQAVWAAVVHPLGVHTARTAGDVVHPVSPELMFDGPSARLSPSGARGASADIDWELRFGGGWHHHDHVPVAAARLGLSGRHYICGAMDLRVSGRLSAGSETWELDGAPAVLGHIFGARSTTDGWAWAHCAAFDGRPDVIFDGIAARLRPAGVPLPPATSLVLRIDGATHAFTSLRQVFRTDSTFTSRGWSFAARSGPVRLFGAAELPDPSRCVRVRYDHAGGSPTWVENSPVARLRLRFEDDRTGIVEDLRSGRASFECAQPTALGDLPHMSG